MLCHSIYLQVVKVHVFNLGLPMNRSFRKSKRFRLLSICANAVYNVIQSLKDISSIRFFCKDKHETLKFVDEFSELKKMTKFKKNTSLSLSLLVDLSMHFDFPRKDVHVPVSLTFSLHLHLQKRIRSRSDRKECFVN